MKIKAKDFKNRAALEQFVVGKDPAKDTVEGTRVELARFGISDRNKIHGLSVVITDDPTPSEVQNPLPERGQVKKGSIIGK